MPPKLSTHQKAVLALIAANIIWGAASPIFKFSLENIPPFTLAFLRFSIASIILLPFVHQKIHDSKSFIVNWKLITLYALFGVTLNIIFFFLGLRLTESINAPIIASSGPIVTLVLSLIFLKERMSRGRIIGAILSFCGIMVIIIQPILEKGLSISVLGNLFLFVAMLGAVGQTIVGKKITSKYPPLPLTFWSFLIGSMTFFPLMLPELTNFPVLDIRAYIGIAFGAVLSSTVAYSLYAWGLSKIDASEVGLFAHIDPIVAIILAYPLLGEKPTTFFVLGALLVFGGIYLAEKRLNYHPLYKLRN